LHQLHELLFTAGQSQLANAPIDARQRWRHVHIVLTQERRGDAGVIVPTRQAIHIVTGPHGAPECRHDQRIGLKAFITAADDGLAHVNQMRRVDKNQR